MPTLTHCVVIQKPGQSREVVFARDYTLPFVPAPGLRISKGDASFVVENLCYHLEEDGFSCRTELEVRPDRPYDEIVDYYQGHGYRIRFLG